MLNIHYISYILKYIRSCYFLLLVVVFVKLLLVVNFLCKLTPKIVTTMLQTVLQSNKHELNHVPIHQS